MNILNALIKLRDDIKTWVTNNLLALENKIKDVKVDYEDITNAPNIEEDNSGALTIADEKGNVILKVNSNGLETTNVTANGKNLGYELSNHIEDENIHITSAERNTWNNKSDFNGDYNSLENTPNISDDGSGELIVTDEEGCAILKVNSNGLETTEVIANGVNLGYTLNTHIEDEIVHITAAERSTWNNKSDFSGDYSELTGAPNIVDDGSGELAITDEAGNTILRVDASGLKTTQVDATTIYADGTDLKDAIGIVADDLDTHATDTVVHITAEERTKWNEVVADAATQEALEAHTTNTTIHVTQQDKDTWNQKSDFSGSYNDLVDKPTNLATHEYVETALENYEVHYEDVIDAPSITTDDDTALTVVDGAGRIALVVDSAGLKTTHIDALDIYSRGVNLKEATETVASDLNDHTTNTVIHITADEREKWNKSIGDAATDEDLANHRDNKDTTTDVSGNTIEVLHVTQAEKDAWNQKSNFSGSYNDLVDKPDLFTEDEADELYVSLEEYDKHIKNENTEKHVTELQISAWDQKSDFSGSYDDLVDKPTIPGPSDYITPEQMEAHRNNQDTNSAGKKVLHATQEEVDYWNQKSDFSGKYEDLVEKPAITEDDSKALNITDETGRIIVTIDSTGLKTTIINADEVHANGVDLKKTLEEHIVAKDGTGYIHVSELDRSRWDQKSDFSGSYEDLVNKPDLMPGLSAASLQSFALSNAEAITISGTANATKYSFTYTQSIGALSPNWLNNLQEIIGVKLENGPLIKTKRVYGTSNQSGIFDTIYTITLELEETLSSSDFSNATLYLYYDNGARDEGAIAINNGLAVNTNTFALGGTAVGENSVAIGDYAYAYGNNSFVLGNHYANYANTMIIGRTNGGTSVPIRLEDYSVQSYQLKNNTVPSDWSYKLVDSVPTFDLETATFISGTQTDITIGALAVGNILYISTKEYAVIDSITVNGEDETCYDLEYTYYKIVKNTELEGPYAFCINNTLPNGPFAIAIGNSQTQALNIDWDGNAYFAGDVYVGGSTPTTGAKLLTNVVNGAAEDSAHLSKRYLNEGDLLNDGETAYKQGISSFALGSYCATVGKGSAAFGLNNEILGHYGFAAGMSQNVTGMAASAFGLYNYAEGQASTAFGTSTIAEAENSFAMGHITHAGSKDQLVIGRQNIIDTNGIYAFILGNGSTESTGAAHQSNALTIDWNGRIWSATGATFSSNLLVKTDGWAIMSVDTADGVAKANIQVNPTTHAFLFTQYDSTAAHYERFYLPTVNSNRTDNGHYDILTSKGGATSGLLYSGSNVSLTSTGFRNIKIITPGTVITAGETAIPTGEIWMQYEE